MSTVQTPAGLGPVLTYSCRQEWIWDAGEMISLCFFRCYVPGSPHRGHRCCNKAFSVFVLGTMWQMGSELQMLPYHMQPGSRTCGAGVGLHGAALCVPSLVSPVPGSAC